MRGGGLRALGLALLAATFVACASQPPMGVDVVDPRTAHRHLTSNVLSTGELSEPTGQLLRRLSLADGFARDPDGTLAELHAGWKPGDEDRLFALAELSYAHGERHGRRDAQLAAAVYAWAFLFPDTGGGPEPFDPRLRVAADLYNRGLAEGLTDAAGEQVDLSARSVTLPFGTLEVERVEPTFEWAGHGLYEFRSAANLRVRGLANRYRRAGIGAPLAARVAPIEDPERAPRGSNRISPNYKVPVTALLRIDRARESLAAGQLRGTLDLHTQDDAERAEIADRSVPLELETTSPLALTLQESGLWEFERAGFFSGTLREEGFETNGGGIFFLSPWRPGRIPLVLVHGTASSPTRWAPMVNELGNDPAIYGRFQAWLFIYNTGNPVALSGARLREAIEEVVAELDPEGHDPALRQMVVIGHSQGGLLTKLTAVDPGQRLWDGVSDTPIDELAISDDTRRLLERALLFERVPRVRRVVFISTPHHGSFLNAVTFAGLQPSRWLSNLINLPGDVLTAGMDLLELQKGPILSRIPTSIDNMTPGNPFLDSLAKLPVAPDVTAHSIIPVKGTGAYEDGNDGVVEYRSAHVVGVASELVVRDGHSTQGNPKTIREVKRILLEHLADFDRAAGR